MTTALQRTSLGELGGKTLGTTSLGELGVIIEDIIEFLGGGESSRFEDEKLILAIIKAFVARM